MKYFKKNIFALGAFILTIAIILANIMIQKPAGEVEFDIKYAERHKGQNAKIYYGKTSAELNESNMVEKEIDGNHVSIKVDVDDISDYLLRFDPVDKKNDFSIEYIKIKYNGIVVWNISSEKLVEYVKSKADYDGNIVDGILEATSLTDDPRMTFERTFSTMIFEHCHYVRSIPWYILLILYVLGGILFLLKINEEKMRKKRVYWWISIFLIDLLCAFGVVAYYALYCLKTAYGNVPFGQLLYHMHTPLDGTNVSTFQGQIVTGSIIVGIMFGLLVLLEYVSNRIGKQKGLLIWLVLLSISIWEGAIADAYTYFGIKEYYEYTHTKSTLYEDYYVDGRDVNITFPKNKRNLIYIYMESMETSYADTSCGGKMTENLIPELTKLSEENIDFSGSDDVLNGANMVNGAEFTMGALVAQTSGVPINENLVSNDTLSGTWESENNYLPGVWTIGDILDANGYNQEFMIGSNAKFAGRSSYFRGHGNYVISDYYTALEKCDIPKDYYVWWGYEDQKLYEFAKRDIKQLAKKNEPFNFTMLTVDTHFTDGYVCDKCEDNYEEQYSNVIACASKQVADFVQWIQKQEFYDNTTIIIAGDHLTMDSGYMGRQGIDDSDGKMYYVIINPADGLEQYNIARTYSSLDLFPTSLAALGVDIDGNRLGLGTNLFSNEPTLIETMGKEELDTQLMMNSDLYKNKLMFGK